VGGDDHGRLNSSELLRDPLESSRIYQRGFRNPPESSEIRGITTRRGRHGVGVRQWGCVAGQCPRERGGGFPWRESGVLHVEQRSHSHARRFRNPMTLQRCNPMTFRCVPSGQAKNPPRWGGFVRAAPGYSSSSAPSSSRRLAAGSFSLVGRNESMTALTFGCFRRAALSASFSFARNSVICAGVLFPS